MRPILTVCISLLVAALPVYAGDAAIRIETDDAVLYPGDVFHLAGGHRAPREQMNGLSVSVGGVEAIITPSDGARIAVVVPLEARPGTLEVILLRRDPPRGTESRCVVGTIEVAPDEVTTERGSTVAGATGARLTVGGASVTLPPGSAPPGTILEVVATQSAAATRRARRDFVPPQEFPDVPPAVGGTSWEISITADVTELTFRVAVPPELATGSEPPPDLFISQESCGMGIELYLEPLDALHADGFLIADIPGERFRQACLGWDADGREIVPPRSAPRKAEIRAAIGQPSGA